MSHVTPIYLLDAIARPPEYLFWNLRICTQHAYRMTFIVRCGRGSSGDVIEGRPIHDDRPLGVVYRLICFVVWHDGGCVRRTIYGRTITDDYGRRLPRRAAPRYAPIYCSLCQTVRRRRDSSAGGTKRAREPAAEPRKINQSADFGPPHLDTKRKRRDDGVMHTDDDTDGGRADERAVGAGSSAAVRRPAAGTRSPAVATLSRRLIGIQPAPDAQSYRRRAPERRSLLNGRSTRHHPRRSFTGSWPFETGDARRPLIRADDERATPGWVQCRRLIKTARGRSNDWPTIGLESRQPSAVRRHVSCTWYSMLQVQDEQSCV